MLANPSVAARAVVVDDNGQDVLVDVHGRANLRVSEVKAGDHAGVAVRPGHHVRLRLLVQLGVLVGDDVGAAGAVPALVVVVVVEDERVLVGGETPLLAEVEVILERVHASHGASQLRAVAELGDESDRVVLVLDDGLLACKVDHFLHDESAGADREAVVNVQIVQPSHNVLEVLGPNVLGGVNSRN